MSTELGWLADGATVACIASLAEDPRVYPAQVAVLGDDDVVVVVFGPVQWSTETFAIADTERHGAHTWLLRPEGAGRPRIHLAALGGPAVTALAGW